MKDDECPLGVSLTNEYGTIGWVRTACLRSSSLVMSIVLVSCNCLLIVYCYAYHTPHTMAHDSTSSPSPTLVHFLLLPPSSVSLSVSGLFGNKYRFDQINRYVQLELACTLVLRTEAEPLSGVVKCWAEGVHWVKLAFSSPAWCVV